ncbi:hemin importer ATP-binding subunit [Slackia heliotrinireducens]|uniref:Predicted ATPase n=1 Tax=Slackia heliotrinireducens (strain ATCC 29202 / DSM 20476 / NCTC 11029 / RHS 1) TaxID=471855 RepID=C7N849_SLAHD|nr:AAA family ATPase [Slackia heliotrinireducens]ACV23084.1 predicted ATPase [Slackia heliotrinireducens DSM 20476]VEH02061.1 hemin importer ATP-binding subunit [Slackia heliotrinireducens]
MYDMRYLLSCWVDWDALPAQSYVRGIPAIASMGTVNFAGNVTFFVGENGSGKSTLLEAIAMAFGFNLEGGTRNFAFSTYEHTTELGEALRTQRGGRRPQAGYYFKAETFLNVARMATIEYLDPRFNYAEMSHGEGFLAFMQSVKREGLFLMDEPEAALSPQRQLTLLLYLHQRAQTGSQFIIATHSPILLGLPGAQILRFDDAISECEYEETDPYQITKMFMDDREGFLHHLFDEG